MSFRESFTNRVRLGSKRKTRLRDLCHCISGVTPKTKACKHLGSREISRKTGFLDESIFLNNIHSMIKMSVRLGIICECEQPFNSDARYGMSIRFPLKYTIFKDI